MRRAGLPMYDLPELRVATDRLWVTIASELRAAGVPDVPASLSRDLSTEALWTHPDLLLAQTCGYPLVRTLAGRVTVVATPVHAVPGCEGARYRSFVVVASRSAARGLGDLRGATCAVNDPDSHSGANALRALIAPLSVDGRFFGSTPITGSHRASLEAVAAGEADVASIDCVTHALLAEAQPSLVAATRIIATTKLAPALPYITGDATLAPVLRAALDRVPADVLAPLRIRRFETLPERAYDDIIAMELDAERSGYATLA